MSPLPSPVGHFVSGISVSPVKPKAPHEGVESLTLEIEVQELLDRVTSLEEGHAHTHDRDAKIYSSKAE